MSGEEKSTPPSIDSRLERIESIIAEYVEKLGIPKVNPNAELGKEYLSMTRDDMNLLTKDECLSRSLVLSQLAMYIQIQSNREQARMNWADGQLATMACVDDGRGTKWSTFEEKKIRVSREDDAGKKLLQIKTYSKIRLDHLGFLANSIKSISDSLRELSKIRGNIDA